ncbi:hypothetical protein B566_EDAN008204 [Ephemera danica]|nr:hypothetical protein B566_EDAN008204 [Ephemera danica]
MSDVGKQEYPKASNSVVYGGLLSYFAGMFLVIAFASPYWIQSYEETFTSFKHMGLWEFCFDQFRYPYYQFDKLFTGCHYIFSQELYVIREWLLPGWLMAVQAFVTTAFILSYTSQILTACQLVRWPLNFVLEYEWLLSGISCIGNAAAAVLLFLAVCIFGGESFRKDWMMYPQYNFISWSYGLAVISMFFHAFAALLIYQDARKNWERRNDDHNLVMQMHPNPGRNGYM